MKKSLLFILFSLLMVFMVSGCGEEGLDGSNNSSNGGNNTGDGDIIPPTQEITTPTLDNITTLQGTYEIEFFYTYVNAILAELILTNNCDKVPEYVTGKSCGENDSSSQFAGKGIISYDETKQKLQIITKVQMNGGTFDYVKNDKLLSSFAKLVDPNKYNYTVYKPIPVSEIKDNEINKDESITGVTGRNATDKTSDNALKNTYTMKVDNDGIITSNMVDKSSGMVDGNVVVRMKKISNEVGTLNPNSAFPSPDISDIFKADVGYNN